MHEFLQLHLLTNKSEQLRALREVKEFAATSYKNMLHEESQISSMLQKHNAKQHGNINILQGNHQHQDQNNNTNNTRSLHWEDQGTTRNQ